MGRKLSANKTHLAMVLPKVRVWLRCSPGRPRQSTDFNELKACSRRYMELVELLGILSLEVKSTHAQYVKAKRRVAAILKEERDVDAQYKKLMEAEDGH